MRRLLVVLLGVTLLSLPTLVLPALAAADDAGPVQLSLAAPPGKAGDSVVVRVALVDEASAPLPGAVVALDRWDGATWRRATTLTTDTAGAATTAVAVSKEPARNRLRATYAGDATHAPGIVEAQIVLVRRATTVALTAPATVVDERTVRLSVRWLAQDGQPVSGKVTLQRRSKTGKKWPRRWTSVAVATTDAQGRASFQRRPRWTTRWRVVGQALPWAAGDTSPVRRTRNLPPGTPVALPKHAPRPRITLPAQRRAVGKGANAVVRRIPTKVWRSMKGRSWHPGCPVGRSGLRLVRVNYWAFDGYRRRGEVVVAQGAAGPVAGAFTEMYQRRIPVRSMYRVDRFGWSKQLGGADDYRSMAADNTSAFNCRGVVGNPSVRSPHSYGRALDLNPWENPYHSRTGVVPNTWWAKRTHPLVAWRSRDHQVVALMARHGLRWTYGVSDAHHFDAVGGSRKLRALLASPACVEQVCH